MVIRHSLLLLEHLHELEILLKTIRENCPELKDEEVELLLQKILKSNSRAS